MGVNEAKNYFFFENFAIHREGELVQKVDTRKTLDVENPSKNE